MYNILNKTQDFVQYIKHFYVGGCPVPTRPVLSQRQASTDTLSSVQPLGSYPSFSLFKIFLYSKSGCM